MRADTQRLNDAITKGLDMPLSQFVYSQRLEGSSWDYISKRIFLITEIVVTGEWLRKHFND